MRGTAGLEFAPTDENSLFALSVFRAKTLPFLWPSLAYAALRVIACNHCADVGALSSMHVEVGS